MKQETKLFAQSNVPGEGQEYEENGKHLPWKRNPNKAGKLGSGSVCCFNLDDEEFTMTQCAWFSVNFFDEA